MEKFRSATDEYAYAGTALCILNISTSPDSWRRFPVALREQAEWTQNLF